MILPILCGLSIAFLLGLVVVADIYRHDPVRGQHIIAAAAAVIANVVFFPIAVGHRLFSWGFRCYAAVIWWEYQASRNRIRQLFAWGCRHFPQFKAYMRLKNQ